MTNTQTPDETSAGGTGSSRRAQDDLLDLVRQYGGEREAVGGYTPDKGTLQRDKAQSAITAANALFTRIVERVQRTDERLQRAAEQLNLDDRDPEPAEALPAEPCARCGTADASHCDCLCDCEAYEGCGGECCGRGNCSCSPAAVEATGSPDPMWLALLELGRRGGENGADAICEAYSRGIGVGLQRRYSDQLGDRDPQLADALGAATSLPRSELLPEVRRLVGGGRAQQVYRDLCAAQLGDVFAFEQQPDRHVLVVIGAFNGTVSEQPQPATAPTNTEERPEDALQRFAGELWRLSCGLADRGIPLRDGPVHGAAVDTALSAIDRRNATIADLDVPAERLAAIRSYPQDRTGDGVPEVKQARIWSKLDKLPDDLDEVAVLVTDVGPGMPVYRDRMYPDRWWLGGKALTWAQVCDLGEVRA